MTERRNSESIWPGLATVYRRASEYSSVFDGFQDRDIAGVFEPPIGSSVLVLREQAADASWAPVVFTENVGTGGGTACFSWVHPDTLRMDDPLPSSSAILVGHCGQRGRDAATHHIGAIAPGSRWHQGFLILDARWEGRGHANEGCSGYCSDVLLHTASEPTRMYDIFRFASERRAGSVVCMRGKHRSVSAAKILELCFRRSVDYSLAARNNQCNYCRSEATADDVYEALRKLPRPKHGISLIQALS
jgi:hypothetical protein